MANKKKQINTIINYPKGREKECREYINDVLFQFYIDAIVRKVNQKVPESELSNVLITERETLLENSKEISNY